MKLVSLIGQKYGKLTVIDRYEQNDKFNKPQWICECECGNTTIVSGNKLRSGNTKSCGCLRVQAGINIGKKSKHGGKGTRLYETWHGMKQRCFNPNGKDYKNYGSRGITVCDEWKDDFKAFYDWAMSNGYEEHLTIDRIDVDGNYEPSNCRWVTRSEQNKNRRNVKKDAI